jgi:hypothetical protein
MRIGINVMPSGRTGNAIDELVGETGAAVAAATGYSFEKSALGRRD